LTPYFLHVFVFFLHLFLQQSALTSHGSPFSLQTVNFVGKEVGGLSEGKGVGGLSVGKGVGGLSVGKGVGGVLVGCMVGGV